MAFSVSKSIRYNLKVAAVGPYHHLQLSPCSHCVTIARVNLRYGLLPLTTIHLTCDSHVPLPVHWLSGDFEMSATMPLRSYVEEEDI
jgi:hypothetical protein